MITIVLAVSRLDYLERVVTCLELLDCDHTRTNILCIVDGEDSLYLRARNLVNDTKFNERLTVRTTERGLPSKIDVQERRRRIAAIHNQAKGLIKHPDGFIFSVEDDTIFAADALELLLNVARKSKSIGFVEGVELGRWGVPYVGAWRADDIYHPTSIKSVENIYPVPVGQPATEIDAGGLYCALIQTDLYKQHVFHSENGLGPDINFGIENRQLGYQNYIVWQVPCQHLFSKMGNEMSVLPSTNSKVVTLTKQNDTKWSVTY